MRIANFGIPVLRDWIAACVRQTLGQERALDLFFNAYWSARDLSKRWEFRRAPTPRVAVLSMWDQSLADLAGITAPNKAAYCAWHGYDWLPCTSDFAADRPVAWSKLLFLKRYLPSYDWLLWSDVDSLVTNPALKIESLTKTGADLVITKDKVGFNSGSFLIRNCSWSLEFLQEAWAFPAHPNYRREFELQGDRLWENRAFLQLLLAFRHRRHAKVLPQRRLNSYVPDKQHPNRRADHRRSDFILHLPGIDHAKRLRILSEYARRLKASDLRSKPNTDTESDPLTTH